MSLKLRPRLEPLGDRIVPASLTFALQPSSPGPVYATATFSMPGSDQIDSEQPSQAVELSDLKVVIDGQTATSGDFSSTPTADFAYGVFQGITVSIVGSIPVAFMAVE